MVGLGMLMVALAIMYFIALLKKRNWFGKAWFLKLFAFATPIGFIAVEAGWTVTEVGRQPWIIQGILRTSAAVTPVQGLWASMFVYTGLYLFLGLIVVRLLLGSVTAEQKLFVLAKPREALGQVGAPQREGWDPRLSAHGNRVSKQMVVLLDRLAWMENFLECRGWTALMACDRLVLGPVFARLARDANCVAEGAGDLAVEMCRP